MIATASGHPDARVRGGALLCRAAWCAWPPFKKHASTRSRNPAVFIAAVRSCAPLPQRIPRHCRTPNPTIIATERSFILSGPARMGKRLPLYSLTTMATAAAVPQVESQSLQPTMKPAYSPIARREKLYWPPLRGIAAPSSANDPHSEKQPCVWKASCDVAGRSNDARGNRVADGGGNSEPHAENLQQPAAALCDSGYSERGSLWCVRQCAISGEHSKLRHDNGDARKCKPQAALAMTDFPARFYCGVPAKFHLPQEKDSWTGTKCVRTIFRINCGWLSHCS